MKLAPCKECGGPAEIRCFRCKQPRCEWHFRLRKVRGMEAFRVVCPGSCRLRRRNRCRAKSRTGRRCAEHGPHEGPHRTGTKYGPGEFRGLDVVFSDGGELTPRPLWKPEPVIEGRYHQAELDPNGFWTLAAQFPGAWWSKIPPR